MRTASRLGVAGAITALGMLVITTISHFEGRSLVAYRDAVKVWTICEGVTEDVKPGMKLTDAQCDDKTLVAIQKHEAGMRRCLKDPDSIPDNSYAAFLSLTYNIGVGGFCRSSVARNINAGNIKAACNRIPAFNKAGGRVLRGLVRRRAAEKKLCLKDLN